MRALAQPYPWAQNLDGREPGPQANKQQEPTVSRTDMDSIELDTNKKLTRHDVKEGVIAMNDAASRQEKKVTILLGGAVWDSARRPRLVNWRIPAQSSTRWRIWLYHGGAGRRQIRRVLAVEFDAASPGESIDGGKILGKRCRGRMWRRLERGKVERVWMRRKRGKRSWSRASAITSRAAVAGGGSSDGVAGAHHLATSFRGSPSRVQPQCARLSGACGASIGTAMIGSPAPGLPLEGGTRLSNLG
ncbi:hypothetical protein B0J15DRAFT_183727 [Fusarium solani]|uniref:Uncharacterized protein n=1 Tax=Fusarium solani TaxID=169388 RepID=A0A9P9RC54_FUSSL|nr:uncharacterized protein B0J15DRAFT_183727 [Fusarium solani]KAH7272650.1 hypothetical protein B0J15DRAFT_183727 [Fusarium solani]